ncbi:uncharacterized protein Tapdelta [Atheta coriaria]|uniref:uncharacterized protein Tapdelta n=1 Tax=Dalotia coriaria TaxID=877792 RepID=UPI0031F46A50
MVSNTVSSLTILLSLISVGLCNVCSSPEVVTTSFTTQDATIVANIAYIGEFSIKCGTGSAGNLYAEVDDNIVPVSIIGSNQYQVSWTEDTKTARSGDRKVRIFTEDGYTAYRKAVRAGECTSSIESLTEIVVNHPGAFYGPWLKSEFLAIVMSIVVAYVAISSKSKLSS